LPDRQGAVTGRGWQAAIAVLLLLVGLWANAAADAGLTDLWEGTYWG
jgi:hypothetical protein